MDNKIGIGSLFNNKSKTNENQPDFIGSITINGKQDNLAGWIRQTKYNQPYISLKVTDPTQRINSEVQKDSPATVFLSRGPIKISAEEDDLPF